MLRASTVDLDTDINLVTQGNAKNDGSVPHASELIALVEAIHGCDPDAMTRARNAVLESLGEAALIDAAAVCAHFEAITRVADTTGVQLDTALEKSSGEIRDLLGLNAFNTTVE